MFMLIVSVSKLDDDGLKLHPAAAGRPLQLNVTGPIPGLESSVNPKFTACPAVIVPVPLAGVIWIGGPMCVGSFAVSFPVFVSPPPDTVAVLVTLALMLLGTFTVSVMAGYDAPGARTSLRV